MTDYNELRRLAEAATPSEKAAREWRRRGDGPSLRWTVLRGRGCWWIIRDGRPNIIEHRPTHAEAITYADRQARKEKCRAR